MAHSSLDSDRYSARLFEVGEILQGILDEDYISGESVHGLRFDKGDCVIVLAAGLYYKAKVHLYYRLASQDLKPTVFPAGSAKQSVERLVPTCIVSYTGYPNAVDNEEIAENELFTRCQNGPAAAFGMLYAHEWNEYKRVVNYKACSQRDMGPGVWFLDGGTYSELEAIWAAEQPEGSGLTSFARYCGRPERTPHQATIQSHSVAWRQDEERGRLGQQKETDRLKEPLSGSGQGSGTSRKSKGREGVSNNDVSG